MLDLSRKHDRATELRAIADGRLLLNVRNGVTVSRSMLAMIADEFEAMSTALAAKDAELAVLKAQLVAAWNAFGPSSSRGDEPPFDTDDLEHLPLSAGGGLDEQIRELEDLAERAEAALAEARKALEPFARLAASYENSLGSDWVGYRGAVYVSDLRAARRGLEQGGSDA